MTVPPPLRAIYDDNHPFLVIQKSAQIGISEYLINAALWVADTHQGGRGNALYVMPTQGAMEDFSQARVHKAIEESPYLRERAHPRSAQWRGAESRRLRRVGGGHLYFRGADRRRQLITIDADLVILDELDEMRAETVETARKRLASSSFGWTRAASTPGLPEAGINAQFLASDQRHYFLPCSQCGTQQRLTWDENLDRDQARVVCRACHHPLDLTVDGEWVAAFPDRDIRGYHLSRLYFPQTDLRELIAASERREPCAVQEFVNSDLGEPWVLAGDQLNIRDLDACRAEYDLPPAGTLTAMGVDVGADLHVIIREQDVSRENGWRLVFAGTVPTFEALDDLILRFDVRTCVIDAQPELHKTREFCAQALCRAWTCWYTRQHGDHQWDDEARSVSANRTLALDQAFDRFRRHDNLLPRDARYVGGNVAAGIGEYYRQLTALARLTAPDATGNPVARYNRRGMPDHFAHAEAYCYLATMAPEPKRRPPGLSFALV